MQITLSDEEYAWLSALAARTGQSVEKLVLKGVAELADRYNEPASSRAAGEDPFIARMRFMSHVMLPDGAPESPEEAELPPAGSEAEERLLTEAGTAAAEATRRLGKSAADLIREDRDAR